LGPEKALKSKDLDENQKDLLKLVTKQIQKSDIEMQNYYGKIGSRITMKESVRRKFIQEAKPSFIKKPSFVKKPFKPEPEENEFIDTGFELDDDPPTKKKRGKTSFTLKDKRGSDDVPCDPDTAMGRRDLGDHVFHPYDPKRDTEDWECNTRIEDELLAAVQEFITQNSVKKIEGKIGEFIVDYFKNRTDNSLPLSRFTRDVPLFRGSKRKLDEYGLAFLKQIQWEKGKVQKIDGTKWGIYPINAPFTLRRDVASFSYDLEIGKKFARNEGKPIQFVYETSGKNETDGGGFFLDFTNIYGLRQNLNHKMIGDLRFDSSTRSFRSEAEALLVTRNTGDKLPLAGVHVDIGKLHKNIMRMDDKDPLKKDFMEIMKRSLTDKDRRRYVRRMQNDRKGIEKWMNSSFQDAVDNKDTKLLKNVGNELLASIKDYSSNASVFVVFVPEEELAELVTYLKNTAQTVWNAYEQLMLGKSTPLKESKKRRVRVIISKKRRNK